MTNFQFDVLLLVLLAVNAAVGIWNAVVAWRNLKSARANLCIHNTVKQVLRDRVRGGEGLLGPISRRTGLSKSAGLIV
jgi:hypothetical protein